MCAAGDGRVGFGEFALMRVRKKNASPAASTPRGNNAEGMWQSPHRGPAAENGAAAMRAQLGPTPPLTFGSVPSLGCGVAEGYGAGLGGGAACGAVGTGVEGSPPPPFLAALSQAYLLFYPHGDGWLPKQHLSELLSHTARACGLSLAPQQATALAEHADQGGWTNVHRLLTLRSVRDLFDELAARPRGASAVQGTTSPAMYGSDTAGKASSSAAVVGGAMGGLGGAEFEAALEARILRILAERCGASGAVGGAFSPGGGSLGYGYGGGAQTARGERLSDEYGEEQARMQPSHGREAGAHEVAENGSRAVAEARAREAAATRMLEELSLQHRVEKAALEARVRQAEAELSARRAAESRARLELRYI